MKKSLVLAMAMALGVTASAYAANPFSDVPAGHWAYDSIDKLAAAGVVEGMGDGSFQGDRHMTRYEMAQIVAKAMAKGANVDKLAAEFADELDALGVRVAALEKKADNVKISGVFKVRSWNYHASNTGNALGLRSDLNITGQINEDWSYHAKLRNDQSLSGDGKGKGEETTAFKDAYVTGRLGGLNVIAGRYNDFLEDGNVLDDRGDMIVASYGKDIKLTAGYGQYDASMQGNYNRLTKDQDKIDHANWNGKDVKFAYGRVDTKLGVVDAHAAYYAFKDAVGICDDSNITAVGIALPVAKDLSLAGTYYHSDADKNVAEAKEINQDGFTFALNYKGASMSKVGSYGIYAKYYDLPKSVYVAHTMDGEQPDDYEGFKGFMLGTTVTVAKNIQFSLDYYNLEGKAEGEKSETVFSMLNFAF